MNKKRNLLFSCIAALIFFSAFSATAAEGLGDTGGWLHQERGSSDNSGKWSFINGNDDRHIILNPSGWSEHWNWDQASRFSQEGNTLVIDNDANGAGMLARKITVKPETAYRLHASVRMDDYAAGEEKPGGATVGFGDAQDWEHSYITDFHTSPEWEESSISFFSGKNTEVTIRLSNGGHEATSRGTAYFKDVYLEEIDCDNEWNVLALIYTQVRIPGYHGSFSEAETEQIFDILADVPAAFEGLSGGRMSIGKLDVQVIDDPVTSVSDREWAQFEYGNGKDIDFDSFLEHDDYNQVIVFAPIDSLQNIWNISTQWYGLGGNVYWLHGWPVHYSIVSGVPVNGNYYQAHGTYNVSVNGRDYNINIAVIMHEMLHSIESNSRLNGWSGFELLHDREKNGYVYEESGVIEWLDWYSDLMRDTIKSGKNGFHPESFTVMHRKS